MLAKLRSEQEALTKINQVKQEEISCLESEVENARAKFGALRCIEASWKATGAQAQDDNNGDSEVTRAAKEKAALAAARGWSKGDMCVILIGDKKGKVKPGDTGTIIGWSKKIGNLLVDFLHAVQARAQETLTNEERRRVDTRFLISIAEHDKLSSEEKEARYLKAADALEAFEKKKAAEEAAELKAPEAALELKEAAASANGSASPPKFQVNTVVIYTGNGKRENAQVVAVGPGSKVYTIRVDGENDGSGRPRPGRTLSNVPESQLDER